MVANEDIINKIENFMSQCTNCGMCTNLCQLYLYHKKKPMDNLKALLHNHFEDLDAFINCNQCGRCKNVCPLGLDYKRLLLDIRTYQYNQNQLLTPLTQLKTSALYHRRRLPDYNNHHHVMKALDKKDRDSVTIIFPGCSGTSNQHPGFKKLVNHIGKTKDIVIYKDCCQVPRQMIGDWVTFDHSLDTISTIFNHHAVKEVLVFCPNCFNAFNNYKSMDHSKLLFFTNLLKDIELSMPHDFGDETIRLHHPCPIKNQKVKDEVEILCQDYKITTVKSQLPICCGSGGMTKTFNKKAYHLYQNNLFEIYDESFIITYCFECQASLKRKDNKVYHLLDFIK